MPTEITVWTTLALAGAAIALPYAWAFGFFFAEGFHCSKLKFQRRLMQELAEGKIPHG